MTSAGGSAGGPAGGLGNAIANAPDAAMQGLERARSMAMEAYQTMMQNTNRIMDGAGDIARDVAGQATGTIVPDAIGHLPEVWL